jgi:hypothetical protein
MARRKVKEEDYVKEYHSRCSGCRSNGVGSGSFSRIGSASYATHRPAATGQPSIHSMSKEDVSLLWAEQADDER